MFLLFSLRHPWDGKSTTSRRTLYYMYFEVYVYCRARQRYVLPCCSLGVALIRPCMAFVVVVVGVRIKVKSSVEKCQSEQKQVTTNPILVSVRPPRLYLGNVGVRVFHVGDIVFGYPSDSEARVDENCTSNTERWWCGGGDDVVGRCRCLQTFRMRRARNVLGRVVSPWV